MFHKPVKARVLASEGNHAIFECLENGDVSWVKKETRMTLHNGYASPTTFPRDIADGEEGYLHYISTQSMGFWYFTREQSDNATD